MQRVLLPANADPASARVELAAGHWEALPGRYDLAPAAPLATDDGEGILLSWAGLDASAIEAGRVRAIYSADAFWPAQPARIDAAGAYRQWRYAQVLVFPYRINPVSGELQRLMGGQLAVRFGVNGQPAGRDALGARLWPDFADTLANADDQARFYAESQLAPQTGELGSVSDYVIVTTASIQAASTQLGAFAAAKQAQGFTVKVVTEGAAADATHYLTGATADARANNIRAWLASHYAADGIEYVLLIGNPHPMTFTTTTSVPMKMTYPRSNATDSYKDSPTDFYYSDLSSNWNADGDAQYGEFAELSSIDRTPEVLVGRIPYYGVIADLDSILAKSVAYGQATGDLSWRQKLLVPAAISNHAPQDNDGDGSAADDYPYASWRTFGADWGEALKAAATGLGAPAYTLYEKSGIYADGTAYPLTTTNAALAKTAVVAEWAKSYGFVAWWGHGSTTGAYQRRWANDNAAPAAGDHITQMAETSSPSFFLSGDTASLNNATPAYVAQVSCSNGSPETTTNLGYSLLKKGAIGTFSASRVSWYYLGAWSAANQGDNASYGYYLYQRMAAQNQTAGQALAGLRASLSLSSGETWMNATDFNLYGDPSLGLNSQGAVVCVAPAAPTLSTPADGAASDNATPTFSWGAASGAESYQVQVDEDAAFTSPVVDAEGAATSLTPASDLALGGYVWRVRAHHVDGSCDVYSPWSAVRSLTIQEAAIAGLTATSDSPRPAGEPVQLTASVTTGENVSYAWDLGDGATAEGASVLHTYGMAGEYTAVVTASNAQGSAQASAIVTVEPALSLTPATQAAASAPGQEVRYEHTLTNKRSVARTFTVSAVSSQGWAVTVASELTVDAEGSATVVVTVTAPEGAAPGASDQVQVLAAASDDPAVSAEAADTTTVQGQAGVTLAPDRTANVNPGQAASYDHTVTNTGASSDTFSFQATSSLGWTVSAPANVTLAAGAQTVVRVTTTSPANAAAGLVDSLTLTAISQNDASASAQVVDATTVNRIVAVALTPSRTASSAANKVIYYDHTITNNGNAQDTFRFTAVSSRGWVVVKPADVTLAAGASQVVRVSVAVPANAVKGQVDTLTLTAISNADASKTAYVTDKTTVTKTGTSRSGGNSVDPATQGIEIVAPAGAVAVPAPMLATEDIKS